MALTTAINSTAVISSHPGMGAILYPGGTAFRVWAKFATQVYVVGDFNHWSTTANPLASEGNGYWSVDVAGAKEGDQYRYLIHSPFLTQPQWRTDPYAKRVEDDRGNGYITSSEFDWGTNHFQMPAWNELVIYELHVGSFYDITNDGIPGNFDDVIKKVDYLKELGINAIELLPIYGFPGKTSLGYNPALPFDIESSYGTNTDFKDFVKAVHAKGIALLLDVVYNHWGPDDLDTALWQIDGWSQDGGGGIYFYNDWRRYTPFGDRPDFGRPEVRQYIRDNVQMWLEEYQVDGLRFDSTVNVRNVYGKNNDPEHDLADGWSLMQWLTNEIDSRQPWKITIAEDLQNNEWINKDTGSGGAGDDVVVVVNFGNRYYSSYSIGFPRSGIWWVRFNSDWKGYDAYFGNFGGYTTRAGQTNPGDPDRMPCRGNVGIAPYSALILSQ